MSRKLRPDPRVSGAVKASDSRHREQRIARILRIAIPLAIALIVVLVGAWGYDNQVGAWSQRVAQVNDTSIDMSHYVKMLRLYRTTQPPITDPWEVLRVIEENELIRQEATALGLTAAPEEVTSTIAASFSAQFGDIQILGPDSITVSVGNSSDLVVGDPDSSSDDPATFTEESRDAYEQRLEDVRLSDAEYRRVVEASLLGEALRENFSRERTPEEAEHVYLHMIPLATEEAANDALSRLDDGEDFASLAAELATVEDIKEAEGDVGWVPRGVFAQIDEIAFSMPIGNVSDAIPTNQGYYILRVEGKSESMPVIDEYRSLLSYGVFDTWLQEQRQAVVVEYLTQSSIDWAIDHVE